MLFAEYNEIKVKQFRETLLLHIGNVKKSVAERTRHKRQYDRRMNERQMQSRESKVVSSKALDASLVVTECSGTKSDEHIKSGSSETYITHVNAYIRPVNDQEPSAEVHLTAQHNVLVNEQQHTNQSEPSYDTYLLEKVDSNTTSYSTNMCHRGGEIDQDAKQDQVKSSLLKVKFLKMNDMVEKQVYNELSNIFLQLEKHCISLEISIQQEESLQSNKPCKNQDSLKFREFFEINELKAQLQAKNSTINNLKKHIKNVHEESNEAKVKHDIDVIETINIELEHKVAKLLKENETLKKHYKDLYDSIKVTRTTTIEQTTSLIAKNNEFKAQLQKKRFTIAALKNELRKLTENSVNTKFTKPSILGKPVLQPLRNQSVVRQPTAYRSERPKFSKPWFSSQVDVNNVLSKPVTPHYLPTARESVFVKPNHVIASGSSRNSTKFSPNKSFAVHEKPNTPRSCLRWKPTGRIFKTAGLRWIPTGKMLIDSTTKVDSEPLNGSNDDITNLYECDQTLIVSAGTLNLSGVSPTPYVPPSKKDHEILFQPLFDEYFNPPPRVVSPVSAAIAAPRAIDPAGSPSSTTIDQDVPSASTLPTIKEIQSQVTHQGMMLPLDSHYLAGRNGYIRDLDDLEHPSDTQVITMKMETLLEPKSNKLLVEMREHAGPKVITSHGDYEYGRNIKSMDEEEVSLVDGIFKGAFGALEALEMEALVDAMEVYGVDNGRRR
nr:hypothetical protein [Tanacetum cinerariifolium]